jgi:hypothetical protein
MAKDATEWWFFTLCRIFVFEALTPDTGYFETNGERRTCFMATQRNRNSTLVWCKSSASGESGECVEVATSELSVLVRDSGNRSGVMLQFTAAQWRGFVGRIKGGTAASG